MDSDRVLHLVDWTFLAKISPVFLGSLVVAWLVESSEGSWSLSVDVQKYYQCLPYSWYVVTQKDTTVVAERGDLVEFSPPNDAALLSEQYRVIKIVAGVEGDRWKIESDRLWINERDWGALHLMAAIGVKPGSLDREGVLKAGEVFVVGTNPSSYDSRYWGPLDTNLITGKAYAIF